MRVTSYYGQALGVRMVEQRRGKISSMTIGTVDRHPPEGADWTLRYSPTHGVDKSLSMTVIDRQISEARRQFDGETQLAEIDRILTEAITGPFPMAYPSVRAAA